MLIIGHSLCSNQMTILGWHAKYYFYYRLKYIVDQVQAKTPNKIMIITAHSSFNSVVLLVLLTFIVSNNLYFYILLFPPHKLLMDFKPNQRVFLSSISLNQNCKKYKILHENQYKLAVYLPYSVLMYHKLMRIRLLRQKQRLSLSKTIFGSQIEIRIVKEQKQSGEPQSYILLQTKFIEPSNILKILQLKISIKQKKLELPQKANLIDKIIRKIILTLMGNTNYQIYNWHDLSLTVDQQGHLTFQIHKGAMTGMNLLLFHDDIQFAQFSKIYEIVTLDDLKQTQPILHLSFQMKIRAIAKILLTLITQRYFEVLQIVPDFKDRASQKQYLTRVECLEMLQKRKHFFQRLFSSADILQKIKTYQELNKVKYLQFLRQVLVKENEHTWQYVMDKIIKKNQQPIDMIQTGKKTEIKNQLSNIITQIHNQLDLKRNTQHIQLFKDLGLYREQNPFLLAVMYLQTSQAEQAIGQLNINQLLTKQNSSKFIIKDEIFRFLLKLKARLLDFNKQIERKSQSNLEQNNIYTVTSRPFDQIEERSLTTPNQPANSLEQNPQQQQRIPQELSLSQSQPAFLREQHRQNSPQQEFQEMQNYLYCFQNNFGRFSMKNSKSSFITENYYSQAFRRYRNVFK